MSFRRVPILWGVLACLLPALAVSRGQVPPAKNESDKVPPTGEEAKKYIENAEKDLFDLGLKASRAAWCKRISFLRTRNRLQPIRGK